MSIGTILAMTLVFFLTFLVASVNDSSERIIDRVEKKVDIGIFFQKGVHTFEIDSFLTELGKLKGAGEIQGFTYYSADFALEEMKQKFPEKVQFLERYRFENPLQASVEIVPGSWGTTEIFAFVKDARFQNVIDAQFLDRYTEKRVEVDRILRFLAFVRSGGFVLVSIFLGISVLLIGFFVFSTLQQKRKEIFIMRLVGAAHSFIRLPFLLEGIVLTCASFLLSFGLFALFLESVAPRVVGFFDSSDQVFMSGLIFEIEGDFLKTFLPAGLCLLIASGLISYFTVERFIKKRHLFAE